MRDWPDFSGTLYEEAVARVLRSGCYTEGPETAALERQAAGMFGVDPGRVVAVSSGTAALELILRASHWLRPGGAILMPAVTFTATAQAVEAAGYRAVLCDVDPERWTLCPADAKRRMNSQTVGILSVDLDGAKPDVAGLLELNLPIVSDACASWGWCHDRSFPMASSAYSLNQTKIAGCGEGGLVVAESCLVADEIRALRCFGEERPAALRRRADIPGGGNRKMTEMTAAMAQVSLSLLRSRIERARTNQGILWLGLQDQELIAAPAAAAETALHKFRARIRTNRKEAEFALAGLKVPCQHREVSPLYAHPGLACYGEGLGFPNAARFLRETVVLGSRGQPLWHADPMDVGRWSQAMRRFDDKVTSKEVRNV